METNSLMLENESNLGFNETVEQLSKTITEKGWKITISHDLQEIMKKNGKDVLPVKVIELCNPTYAFGILSEDESRYVSPMLPCRISVYEKSDGKTYIARMNSVLLAKQLGGNIEKIISQAFADGEDMIKPFIE
ncbi:MAG: DUF302 domain-containing protein [Lentimicrobium sp.]|nr:DUF302 domain-containing protein [Lentimicrobium sp.]